MSEFIDELLAGSPVVAREVEFDGKKGTVYFRRISAGERVLLLKGQKVLGKAGEAATVEIDLAENARTKHLMVKFSACKADKTPVFKSLDDVAKNDAKVIDMLYQHAAAVNGEDDAGKG